MLSSGVPTGLKWSVEHQRVEWVPIEKLCTLRLLPPDEKIADVVMEDERNAAMDMEDERNAAMDMEEGRK